MWQTDFQHTDRFTFGLFLKTKENKKNLSLAALFSVCNLKQQVKRLVFFRFKLFEQVM